MALLLLDLLKDFRFGTLIAVKHAGHQHGFFSRLLVESDNNLRGPIGGTDLLFTANLETAKPLIEGSGAAGNQAGLSQKGR
jgi:hypothetical protein